MLYTQLKLSQSLPRFLDLDRGPITILLANLERMEKVCALTWILNYAWQSDLIIVFAAGPGSYNLAVATGKQILSDKRSAGGVKFSQAPIPSADPKSSATISPGPIYEFAQPTLARNCKIGRALRQGLFADCDTNGCANYKMEAMTSMKRGGGTGFGKERRFRSGIPMSHSTPGFVYNPEAVVNFHSGPSSSFGRASKRFGRICNIDSH